MHRFPFFFKEEGEAIPILDNTQKGVKISDVFQWLLKYKHYSKQKTFENFREGQLRTNSEMQQFFCSLM